LIAAFADDAKIASISSDHAPVIKPTSITLSITCNIEMTQK